MNDVNTLYDHQGLFSVDDVMNEVSVSSSR